jgi:hypothetical protein
MSEAHTGRRGSGAIRCENGNAAAIGAADFLYLGAAPTFAIMALLTGVLGGAPDMLCSATPGASPFGGMVAMYLLMSAFHLAPWLKLFSARYRISMRRLYRAGELSRRTSHVLRGKGTARPLQDREP